MHRYPIGTKYKSRGKHPRTCTVVDQLTTTNSKGEIVNIRYVSQHEFVGQIVTDSNVCDTTIARGIINTP